MPGKTNSKSKINFIIRIAGEAGEGVISCGELFAKAIARTYFHVFSFITYPAEMKGGYSMIQVRFRDKTIYSMGSFVNCLLVFNQRAYDNSISVLKPGGIIIYDPDTVTLDADLDAVKYPVRFEHLAVEQTGKSLAKNVISLGVLTHLYGLSPDVISKMLEDRYGKYGEQALANNLKAFSCGIDEVKRLKMQQSINLASIHRPKEDYMFISGNQAVALGAIAAGCRFTAGYPLTPSTSIFETLAKYLPLVGGKSLQMEDEIAAISAIIGASFAGEKVITATSGPGLQLMAEQMSLASMLELPIVIVNVQRGGPSTGLPTKTEQGDLKFAVYGSAGDAPKIILAPTGVEDTFYQTIRAFNLAEKYQLPVIILTDQSIAYRKATVRIPDFTNLFSVDALDRKTKVKIPCPDKISIRNRMIPTEEELQDYKRYKITLDGISPISRPGTLGGQYLATGLEHDEYGRVKQTPEMHLAMSKKRQKKLFTIAKAFEENPVEIHGDTKTRIGVIGWGSTEGAIREARYMAEKKGVNVRHLQLKTVSPLPEVQISRFLHRLLYVIIPEENLSGQLAHFLKAKFKIAPIEVHKCEGIPFTPDEIFNAMMKVGRIADEDQLTKL